MSIPKATEWFNRLSYTTQGFIMAKHYKAIQYGKTRPHGSLSEQEIEKLYNLELNKNEQNN